MKKLFSLFAALLMAASVFAGRTFDGTEKLYFNAAGGPSWWAGVDQTAYFKDMGNTDHSVAGTNIGDNIYEFIVPAGEYQSLYIQRGTWNKTGNIALTGTEATNYISVFAENSADVTWTVYEAPAPLPTRNFSGTEKLYFNAAGGPNWWAGVDQTAYLKPAAGADISVSGVVVAGNIYEFTIPAGDYQSLYIQRGTWNKTGNIPLAGTESNNYISAFAENSADVTWDTYNPAAGPEPIVYSIKTNWKEGGWDAGFKELTVNDDGTQSITETYTGNGFNISPNFLGTDWYPVDKLNLVGGVAANDLVTISVNPNATSQEEVFTITKISSPEPEPELDPINVTVRVYTTAAAPKIWWWGGDIAGADATYSWDGRPSMNKEGETNWYYWTFEGVNATSGISYKITATTEKEFSGVKEDKCLDANLNDLDCEYAPEPEPEPTPFTFANNSTWYFDFTAISGGANWPTNTGGSDYDANAGGKIKSVTFTQDVTKNLGEGWASLKTNTGGWAEIALPEETPADGVNCIVIAADGKTASWSTYTPDPADIKTPYTFVNGSTWYFDFTAVSGGANWPTANGESDYDANAGGKVKSVTFTQDVTKNLGEGWASLKTETGSWTSIELPAEEPEDGVNCIVIAADGLTTSWSTYIPAPAVQVTLYFVNKPEWETVMVHMYGGEAAATTWPGVATTKEADQIGDYDVYSITYDEGAYATVIFNNGGNGAQTADLNVNTTTPYFYDGAWYADAEAVATKIANPDPEPETRTAYFLNTPGYETVYAYVYNTNGGLGTWPGELATATGETMYGYDVYSYTFLETYTNVIFHGNTGTQNEYAFDSEKPYITEVGTLASLEAMPKVEATISQYQYSTLYSDKALRIPEGVKVEYVTGLDDDNLQLEEITGIIPANTGVLISGPANTEFTFVEAKTVESIQGNLLHGSVDNEEINNGSVHYILSLSGDNFGLWWPAGTDNGIGAFNNKGGKAYLEIPEGSAGVAVRGFILHATGNATGVESILSNDSTDGKIMKDGQVLIIREGHVYNVLGVTIK